MKKLILVISVALNVAFAVMWVAGVFKFVGCGKNASQAYDKKGAIESLHSEDRELVDRVVEAYDRFVRSRMGDSLPLAEAYTRFFEKAKNVEYPADPFNSLALDSIHGYSIAYDLVSGSLLTTIVRPSYYSAGGLRSRPMWYFNFDYDTFVPFFQKVALESGTEFWLNSADAVEATGDLPPTFVASLINAPHEIDYNDLAQRFIVAFTFLPANYGDNFIIKADLPQYEMINTQKE